MNFLLRFLQSRRERRSAGLAESVFPNRQQMPALHAGPGVVSESVGSKTESQCNRVRSEKPGGENTARSSGGINGGKSVALVLLCALLGGCATSYSRWSTIAHPPYQPENVYLRSPILSPDVRRVAVLPVAADCSSTSLAEACDRFELILNAELAKTRRFEVVCVAPEMLRSVTGRGDWTATEPLPSDLFGVVQRHYACDAALFTELTVFHAYPPMAVGLRMRLVDVRTKLTLWASDEVFDASNPRVLSGALRYASDGPFSNDGGWAMVTSPNRFGQYAIARLLDTLPER